MQTFDLYRDIARRTGGDIYIGVVGPVRAGKSTLIAKIMQETVLPLIGDENIRTRAQDEVPQSADGKMIMTTQPRFVPAEAVTVPLGDHATASVRMVDCVGYVVDGSAGAEEEGKPRLVKTPWSDIEMPFEAAAEFGTKKVMQEHSTIGIVVTTDGSIGTDLPRSAYAKAEERVIADMKATGKPFLVILNTTAPQSETSKNLAESLSVKYGVTVVAADVASMSKQDIDAVMESIMLEFPVAGVDVVLPKWVRTLESDHALIVKLMALARDVVQNTVRMRDYVEGEGKGEDEDGMPLAVKEVRLGEGKIVYEWMPKPALFWRVISDSCGAEIDSDYTLMAQLNKLVRSARAYDRMAAAIEKAEQTGYGIVEPAMDDLILEAPGLTKQGNRYGVKLCARAPSYHLLKVDINAEVSPVVGSEQQSKDLVNSLMEDYKDDPNGVWDTQIFGKSLHTLVKEDMDAKLHSLPDDTQEKMRKTLTRILNEGKGGIVCIML